MTTVLAQLNDLAQAVEAIAANSPGAYRPELAALAYVVTDAANMAHLPRLRHLFDVPVKKAKEQSVTVVTAEPVETEKPEPKGIGGRKPRAQNDILQCVRDNPGITTPAIIATTGYSRVHTQAILKRMAKAKRVRRSGHKPGSPAQWWVL